VEIRQHPDDFKLPFECRHLHDLTDWIVPSEFIHERLVDEKAALRIGPIVTPFFEAAPHGQLHAVRLEVAMVHDQHARAGRLFPGQTRNGNWDSVVPTARTIRRQRGEFDARHTRHLITDGLELRQ